MNSQLPFLIIRSYGPGLANDAFTRATLEANRKYPGLIEEIWFDGGTLDGMEATRKEIAQNLPYREECQSLGIRYSFQQGVTLNHSADEKERAHFSADAWVVTEDGVRHPGCLCPTSPEAQAYTRQIAGAFLAALQPESYWPDDDLRLQNKVRGHLVCFCDRCMARFNQAFHHNYTREELVRLLNTNDSPETAAIRLEWTLSNARNLREYAAVFREAVDKEAPGCMLGLQSVYASWMYNGPDYFGILKGFSGLEGKPVGIRPGAGYYQDRVPMEMFAKALEIQQESARCARHDFICQICYECENWPHVAAGKNPAGQMEECALSLASGADSLALYWGSDLNRESDELTEFYFDVVAEYKPYLLEIRNRTKGTLGGGLALFRGHDFYQTPDWMNARNSTEMPLVENALPMTRMDASPDALVLDARCVAELALEDLPGCFSQTVLMDIAAFRKLQAKFPLLLFPRQIQLLSIADLGLSTSGDNPFECFEGKYLAMDLVAGILPQVPEVIPYSSVTTLEKACGTCVMPTEFGGKVILTQSLDNPRLWTGFRRKAVLDALDACLVQGMPVRLNTAGFSIGVLARKAPDGKTAAAFLLNKGIGRTMPLELTIRNPAGKDYALYQAGRQPIPLSPVRQDAKEMLFQLPALGGWQSLLVAPRN